MKKFVPQMILQITDERIEMVLEHWYMPYVKVNAYGISFQGEENVQELVVNNCENTKLCTLKG